LWHTIEVDGEGSADPSTLQGRRRRRRRRRRQMNSVKMEEIHNEFSFLLVLIWLTE
jgi:hypothetical protein